MIAENVTLEEASELLKQHYDAVIKEGENGFYNVEVYTNPRDLKIAQQKWVERAEIKITNCLTDIGRAVVFKNDEAKDYWVQAVHELSAMDPPTTV